MSDATIPPSGPLGPAAASVAAALPGKGHAVVRADLADPDAVRAMSTRRPGPSAASTCW